MLLDDGDWKTERKKEKEEKRQQSIAKKNVMRKKINETVFIARTKCLQMR